jgi:hypothetical protein
MFVPVPSHPQSDTLHDIPTFADGLGEPSRVDNGAVDGERAAARKDETVPHDRSPSPVGLPKPGSAAEMVGRPTSNPSSRSTPPEFSQPQSFLGVVITRPPKKRRLSSSATSVSESGPHKQSLVSALAQAFQDNSNVIAPNERGLSRPTEPRAKRPSVPPQRTPLAEPRIRPPPLRAADIAATLETREATVSFLKVGGPGVYSAEAWENFTFGSGAGWRRRVNLRFVEAAAHIEGQGVWESGRKRERAVAELSMSRREQFIERLEEMFGPGSVHRGSGQKPKEVWSESFRSADLLMGANRSGALMVSRIRRSYTTRVAHGREVCLRTTLGMGLCRYWGKGDGV